MTGLTPVSSQGSGSKIATRNVECDEKMYVTSFEENIGPWPNHVGSWLTKSYTFKERGIVHANATTNPNKLPPTEYEHYSCLALD